jgi:hypothetical protein
VSELKAGDKVWVLCEVATVYKDRAYVYIDVRHHGAVFEAKQSDCRPVEPAIERDLQKFSPGDSIRVASPSHEWHGKLGEVLCFDTQGDDFISYMVKLHDLDYAVPIPSHLMRLNNPRPTKEPTEAQKLAERTMKAIWVANDAVNGTPAIKEPLATKPNSSEIPNSSSDPLAPSPCMDGVDADQFIEGVMDARGRTSGLQVGDAVRFVSPGHNRHGTQGVLKSIHHGPKNAYLFVSNCGQFHRYCTIAELERVDQANPIDIKGSMQSLDGADTIQEGDLQWTDRDGKYRLCNFTLGMRVHEAIQRGKAHGEKWVFYRKFKEVGE